MPILLTRHSLISTEELENKGRAALVRRLQLNPMERGFMLNWALAFFLIAILAAILGFTGVAVAFAGMAKILFFVFLLVFLVALVMGVTRRA
jgi:uncharacterized membrane protein YtjA (UPF0391 family)